MDDERYAIIGSPPEIYKLVKMEAAEPIPLMGRIKDNRYVNMYWVTLLNENRNGELEKFL